MKFKYIFLSLVLFASLLTVILLPVRVNAASTWLSTSSVYVENNTEGYLVDYSDVVYSTSALNGLASTVSAGTCSPTEFSFALDTGYIAVSQVSGTSTYYGERFVQIHYNSVGPTPTGSTVVSNTFIEPPTGTNKYATIDFRPDTGLTMRCGSTPGYLPVSTSPSGISGNVYSVFYSTYPADYPPGYDGDIVPESPPVTQITAYPQMGIIVQPIAGTEASLVKVEFVSQWLVRYNLPNPDYTIFTLTDMDDNIIVADRCWGPSGCDWNQLPDGDYKMRLDVIYNSDDINENYIFPTTEAWFQVNGTSYTMLFNESEGKFCTVRNGYEWNCSIPQPGETPSLINGDPEVWIPGECVLPDFPWVDIPVCLNNVFHYIGEYLGINGPSVQPGASPFFQFSANTYGLASVITAPVAILTSLQNSEYSCTAPILPLPFLGTTMPLPCLSIYYQEYFTDMYNVFQTIINGIVAYYVLVGVLRTIKDSVNPKDDKIEVMSL